MNTAALLLALAVAGAPERARIPGDVSLAGLLQLSRQGEVLFLPRHNIQPFNAVIVSSSPGMRPHRIMYSLCLW